MVVIVHRSSDSVRGAAFQLALVIDRRHVRPARKVDLAGERRGRRDRQPGVAKIRQLRYPSVSAEARGPARCRRLTFRRHIPSRLLNCQGAAGMCGRRRNPEFSAGRMRDHVWMSWIAPQVTRIDEPLVADERTMLEGWLEWHRATLLWKCAGLPGEFLAQRPVPPSNLSLLGLVRHMAEVERSWFRRRFGGQPEIGDLYCNDEFPDGDFDLAEAGGAEADFATFTRECELARQTAEGRSLDATFIHPRGGIYALRWVYLHMIEEYARHNGHADLLRERIDGVTGD